MTTQAFSQITWIMLLTLINAEFNRVRQTMRYHTRRALFAVEQIIHFIDKLLRCIITFKYKYC